MYWTKEIFTLFVITTTSVIARNEIYQGHKVYRVRFHNEKLQENLGHLKNENISFWRKPSHKYGIDGLAMVPKENLQWFEGRLEDLEVEKQVVIDDVYDYLKEKELKLVKTFSDVGNREFSFNAYYRYDEIREHLASLSEMHSSTINLVQLGTTVENRPLVYVEVSASEDPKPIVIIEAGINPREWITIPAAINVIHQLHESANYDLLRNFDWIIIPVVNPDGYEYTYTNLRFWEKNRSMRSNLGFICPGVNVDRNFDMAWMRAGASESPCSDIYAGTAAFSEEESRMIKAIYDGNRSRLSLYISIHNEGSFISYPWRFEHAASYMFRQHHLLGLDMINAMGTIPGYNLDIGSVAFGDRASGTSTDYMQYNGVLYTLNIGIAQDENSGFVIPEENINSHITPVWNAISFAANYISHRS